MLFCLFLLVKWTLYLGSSNSYDCCCNLCVAVTVAHLLTLADVAVAVAVAVVAIAVAAADLLSFVNENIQKHFH